MRVMHILSRFNELELDWTGIFTSVLYEIL